MQHYRHILIAVDFSPTAERVVQRALDIAACHQAQLSLLHVVEYLAFALDGEYFPSSSMEIEAQLLDSAKAQLAKLVDHSGVPKNVEQRVEIGSTKLEILRYAQEHDVDLIVIGSHGRHGWARILGSTANAVLHGADCDVLALRVPS